jgi:flagellar biogenesis protein FliO
MTAPGDTLQLLTSAGSTPSLWGPALRLLLGTVAIAALVLLSRRWLGALLTRSVGGGRSTPLAKVIGRHFISPKKALVLVEVEGHRLLLAETAGEIRLLLELSPAAPTFDQMLDQEADAST